MAEGDLPSSDEHGRTENGLQRDMPIDKDLQDKIFQELDTLNTEASRINDIEKGLSVGTASEQTHLVVELIYHLNRRVEENYSLWKSR